MVINSSNHYFIINVLQCVNQRLILRDDDWPTECQCTKSHITGRKSIGGGGGTVTHHPTLNSTWASKRATTGAAAALHPLTRARMSPSCLEWRMTLMKPDFCALVSSTNSRSFSFSSSANTHGAVLPHTVLSFPGLWSPLRDPPTLSHSLQGHISRGLNSLRRNRQVGRLASHVNIALTAGLLSADHTRGYLHLCEDYLWVFNIFFPHIYIKNKKRFTSRLLL